MHAMQTRLPHPGRHPRDADRRGQDRRIRRMATVLDRIPDGSRVAVVRIRSLGDCVLTTPALAILKGSRPDLRIGIVVEDRFAGIFTGNPDVEAILPPKRGGVASWRPYFCLNVHGGTRSMSLTTS